MQSISLGKNQVISLAKVRPSLTQLHVGLGWDVNAGPGAEFDADLWVIELDQNGTAVSGGIVFYGAPGLRSSDGAIQLSEDNRDGEGEGDDEFAKITLANVSPQANKLMVIITLHEADVRGQDFGMLDNAFVRLEDETSADELARYDVARQASGSCVLVMGELFRDGAGWDFKALGQSYPSIPGYLQTLGINAG